MKDLREKPEYCWFIVAAGLIMMACSMGIVNNCFSLFTIPVTGELGFSRNEFALNQSLIFIGTMIATPLVGVVVHRFPLLRVVRIAAVVIGVLYFGYALSSRLWHFYLVSFLLGNVLPFITSVPISMLVGQWFHSHLGLALGISFMGSGIGGMIFNPVAAVLMKRFGWRSAFGVIAGIMLVILVPITVLVLCEIPEKIKAKETGTHHERVRKERGQNLEKDGSALLFNRRFWLFIALSMLVGAGTYTTFNFTSTYLQDAGYTAYYSALIASVSMGGMAVGKVLMGRMYDRAGLRKTTLLMVLFIIVGCIGGSLISYPWAVALLIMGAALGCPAGTITSPMVAKYVFGNVPYSHVLSLLVAFGNLGAAATPVLAGTMYEYTGSYLPMYQIVAVLMVLVLAGYGRLLPRGKGGTDV